MKNVKELEIGDTVFTWCRHTHRPHSGVVQKIAVVVETVGDDGDKRYGTIAVLDSIYPEDFLADDAPTTEDELFLRLQDQARLEVLVFEHERALSWRERLAPEDKEEVEK